MWTKFIYRDQWWALVNMMKAGNFLTSSRTLLHGLSLYFFKLKMKTHTQFKLYIPKKYNVTIILLHFVKLFKDQHLKYSCQLIKSFDLSEFTCSSTGYQTTPNLHYFN